MKPSIDQTSFGSITIEGTIFEHDVIIRLNGLVEKRKKKLSKAVYGTSHIVSLAEAKHIHAHFQMRRLIISSVSIARWICCLHPWQSEPGMRARGP